MNGKLVEIKVLQCDECGASCRYNLHNSVTLVDAYRAVKGRCTCKEE